MFDKKFGVEIELTGITRSKAAQVVKEVLNSNLSVVRVGDYYDTYKVIANDSRVWKVMYDGSLKTERKQQATGRVVLADSDYSVEVVTPILTSADMGTLQEVVRALRKAGGFVNSSCGIHVHVDGSGHTEHTLANFINAIDTRYDLIAKGLNILPSRQRYCRKLEKTMVDKIRSTKLNSLKDVEDIWYDGYYQSRSTHYHQSRYHLLNLHSFFNGHHTVEIRGFNSTLHAGKVRAYVTLALALNNQALTFRTIKVNTKVELTEEKARRYLRRIGVEDKVVIDHLTEGYRQANSAEMAA